MPRITKKVKKPSRRPPKPEAELTYNLFQINRAITNPVTRPPAPLAHPLNLVYQTDDLDELKREMAVLIRRGTPVSDLIAQQSLPLKVKIKVVKQGEWPPDNGDVDPPPDNGDGDPDYEPDDGDGELDDYEPDDND